MKRSHEDMKLSNRCESCDNNPVTLIVAVYTSCVKCVRRILTSNPVDVNCTDTRGISALEIVNAIPKNQFEIYKLLLTHPKIDINCCSNNGISWTPFMHEVRRNHVKIVDLFLSHKDLDINHQDVDGRTALFYAINCGYVQISKMLLAQSNIQVNFQHRKGLTLLCLAARKGQTEIVKLLLIREATVNWIIYDWYTDEIKKMLRHPRSVFPKWSRFGSCKLYPQTFNTNVALPWLLCCKRLKVFPKDMRYFILEHIAEAWKSYMNKIV